MNEDKATRYHRLKRRASLLALAWSILFLAAMLSSGASMALRAGADSAARYLTSDPWTSGLAVVVYVVGLAVIHELGSLPIAFYSGLILERRYGLSNERFGAWLRDQAKFLVIAIVFAVAAASIVYFFIRRSPAVWWLPAGAIFALVIVGIMNLAPVLLLPLFYRAGPLDRETLRARLLTLAERTGARVRARTSGVSATKRKRPMRRSPDWARRAGFWCRTRCWPNTPTKRSKSCWRTSWRTTCTATSGRDSRSRAPSS